MMAQAGLVLAGMAIIHVWHSINKTIPPSLVCIGALTAVSKFSHLGLRTVADQCGRLANATLPSFHIPQV
jgi:MFS superfamily sulfate permease-like transporter